MSNKYGLNRLLGGGIATIALVVLLGGWVVLTMLRQLDEATAAHAHSNTIINLVDTFRSSMLNQETGVRGYLITKQKASLEPYELGRRVLDTTIAQLDQAIDAESMQRGRFKEAEAAARAWQKEVGEPLVRLMEVESTRPEAEAIEATGRGKQFFDQFREKLVDVRKAEQQALATQDEALRRAERHAILALWSVTLVTLAICALVALAVARLIVRPLTELALAMRRLARRDLEAQIPHMRRHNEVGAMARAVAVFKKGLIELDRTSLLRATADTLPAMVGYIDVDRRVGFLNGEFATWFDLAVGDVSELHGRPLDEAFPNGSFPGVGPRLDDAFAGADTRFEHRITRQPLGRRDIDVFYRPHTSPAGEVLGVVTLLTDITERKRMERRLAVQTRNLMRSNEELEQFAYVASHDLKAPLRGIENLVSWIEEDLETVLTGDTRTNMDLLKSRVRRLESLLDDLLAYSRAGRVESAAETIDVAALVKELAVLIEPPPGFAIEGSATLPTIVSAKAPLTQAIQNLIGNAIKHHDRPGDGHVWVDGQVEGDMATFVVTDDGPGIPVQYRDRVFGMFQTLRPRDEVEGSGMGLAIVRKLVDRHGGRIWLDDGRDGRGVSVHFTWPRTPKGTDDGADG